MQGEIMHMQGFILRNPADGHVKQQPARGNAGRGPIRLKVRATSPRSACYALAVVRVRVSAFPRAIIPAHSCCTVFRKLAVPRRFGRGKRGPGQQLPLPTQPSNWEHNSARLVL